MRAEIVDYKQSWAQEFAGIAKRLRHAFGPLALRIDHIGSTSVPGLAAKDVIDVQITVPALESVDQIAAALEAAGYRLHPDIGRDHRPPGDDRPDREWFKLYADTPPGQRPTHVHIRAADRPNQRYALLFRDYLRTHAHAARSYEKIKLTLALRCPDSATYADEKDPVCDLVMLEAESWATATNWQP